MLGIRRPLVVIVAVALAAGAAASVAYAQFGRGFGRFRYPPKFATPDTFDGSFNFCRGMYQSSRREAGGQGWSTDYPDADLNFSIRLSELTKTSVGRDQGGEPRHVVVRLTDEALFQCPFVLFSDVGTASFSDIEARQLHDYLLKGGFIWVDDFWGPSAWEHWRHELEKVLPPSEYPIIDVAPDHAIFRSHFTVEHLPQIPSIQFWRMSGGGTSERGQDSAEPRMMAIGDRHGRLMAVMTHNTDISDAWEREGEDRQFFYSFSPDGYAVGINVILYAMTH